jgi:cyanate permease
MPLLAHQGGWDEALFVLAPVGFFAFLLWLANRRAAKRLEADATIGRPIDDPGEGPTTG